MMNFNKNRMVNAEQGKFLASREKCWRAMLLTAGLVLSLVALAVSLYAPDVLLSRGPVTWSIAAILISVGVLLLFRFRL